MTRPRRFDVSANAAFTIIELLVVIGIIAVLVGLLMPALAAARVAAQSIQCASNLRQIAIAFQQYAVTWNGLLPNNSYTLSDDPATLNPPPPAGTLAAAYAQLRGQCSTSNYQWFDAIAASSGWGGKRTVATRCGAGQGQTFRARTQYLWCPGVNQDIRDVGVYATNYGMAYLVARSYFRQESVPPTPDSYSFDFFRFFRVRGRSDLVCLTECRFRNANAEPYDASNASLANISRMNASVQQPVVAHRGLNYLYFDCHVGHERVPPHPLDIDTGTFTTIDGDKYTITSTDLSQFQKILSQH